MEMSLGQKIKAYREAADMQLEDMAEAIESDAVTLAKLESGESTVDEETLALVSSLFKLNVDQATELWEMAGYDTINARSVVMKNENENEKDMKISLPADVKVLYTDMIQIETSKYGMTLQFMQSAPGNNAMVVSRIGLSQEHAKVLASMLSENLELPKKTPKKDS